MHIPPFMTRFKFASVFLQQEFPLFSVCGWHQNAQRVAPRAQCVVHAYQQWQGAGGGSQSAALAFGDYVPRDWRHPNEKQVRSLATPIGIGVCKRCSGLCILLALSSSTLCRYWPGNSSKYRNQDWSNCTPTGRKKSSWSLLYRLTV